MHIFIYIFANKTISGTILKLLLSLKNATFKKICNLDLVLTLCQMFVTAISHSKAKDFNSYHPITTIETTNQVS